MTEVAKKKPGRPPKVVQTATDVREGSTIPNDALHVDGVKFRWVNAHQRNKHGWKIWRVVEADSELGQEVMRQIGASVSSDGNLIINEGSTLAFASIEDAEKFREELETKAEERISTVDAAELRRNVIIPAAPGFGRK